jgi:uncharacterized protein with von Willebrand factor type A (vWA) domain
VDRVTATAQAAAVDASTATMPFPSVAWFQRLADAMNASRARQEQLGYVDCVAEFTVTGDEAAARIQVTFEEFEAIDVRPADPREAGRADFAIEAPLAVWRSMIESIARGGGRPDLDQTLNRLSHFGTPMCVVSDDPLRRDLFFRYNQSLQEFVNASAAFRTSFPD